MKKIIILLIAGVFVTGIQAQYAPRDLNRNWNARLTDDFATFNETIWGKAHHHVHNGEPQIYLRGNVRMERINGKDCAVIDVKKEDYYHNGTTHHYTSGQFSTKTFYRYGYFEMRAMIPAGRGYFPAFWLWNSSQDNAEPCWYNEIDIFEMDGSKDIMTNTVHFYFDCPSSPELDIGTHAESCNYSGGFHWYSMEWDPENITWYLDHRAIRREANNFTHEYATEAGIHHEMKLIINLALFSSTSGNLPPDHTTPDLSSMYIDKVNIYQLKTEDCDVPVYEIPNFNTFRYGVKQSITLTSASTLPPQSDITLRVRDFVELKNDFTIPAGTEFCIIPSSCYENDIE